MTKEEAKKSLQGTKVYVAGKSKEIQEKLFELGFRWWSDDSDKVRFTYDPFLYLDEVEICAGCDMDNFRDNRTKEVTADYILGLTWEEDKPQYQFKPFDKVLVRDDDDWDWRCNLFSHYNDVADTTHRYVCVYDGWKQCIPYEGNEDLVGTTNKPKQL